MKMFSYAMLVSVFVSLCRVSLASNCAAFSGEWKGSCTDLSHKTEVHGPIGVLMMPGCETVGFFNVSRPMLEHQFMFQLNDESVDFHYKDSYETFDSKRKATLNFERTEFKIHHEDTISNKNVNHGKDIHIQADETYVLVKEDKMYVEKHQIFNGLMTTKTCLYDKVK